MDSISNQYLDKLASLRFFAALIVVIFHFGHFLAPYDNIFAVSFNAVATYGFVGVSIFFVLSGFVISLANERWKGGYAYLIGRLTRIYPPHLIVTLTLFLSGTMMYLTHGWWPIVLANMTLMQAWIPHHNYYNSLNIVTWSLSVEIFFYVAFILIRHLRDRYIYFLSMVCYICLVAWTLHLHVRWNFNVYWQLYINPIARLPEFLVGMAIYRLYRSHKLPKLWLRLFNFPVILSAMIATLYIVGSYSALGVSFKEPLTYTTVPLPFIALMIVALLDEKSNSYMHNKYLILLGESSFALYLIHRPIIKMLGQPFAIQIQSGGLMCIFLMVSIICITIMISVLFYKLIELPITHRLRTYFLDGMHVPPAS